jgi:hypothetical protein
MTRRITRSVFVALTLTALSTAAAAQAPGADDARPRTELSQINGTPIKVGEHNQYYYDYPKWNVSTNPFGVMYGGYNVSISYAASEHVALRGDLNYFAINDSDAVGYELGVGAPLYFKKMYNGFFLEPGLIIREFRDSDSHYDEGNKTVGPQILAGWHWTWDSGFNVALAFGMGRDLANDSEYGEDVFPNGYFRVGYAF